MRRADMGQAGRTRTITALAAVAITSFSGFAASAVAQPAPASPQSRPAAPAANPATSATPTLPRSAWLGVGMQAGEGGVAIASVAPGSTAAAAGLLAGDVVTAINGQPVTGPPMLAAAMRGVRVGEVVRIAARRGAAMVSLSASAIGRAPETYQGARADYGAVAFEGGLLRDILVTPDRPAPGAPVVFYLQGVACGSVEGPTPQHLYRRIVQGLADRGIAVYRIEKPGMGDSRGGPECASSDFATEVRALEAGWRALTGARGVAASRVVMLGHSMGGSQAPLLAARGATPAGVIVSGTVVRSWHDYLLEVMRVQGFARGLSDPAEDEAQTEAMRPVLETMIRQNRSPRDIAAADPAAGAALREALNWDGGDLLLGRHWTYWRQLAGERLAAAWKATNAPVLSVYGEVDYAAIDDSDHRLIADIANHYRPGSGRFVLVPRTGHAMSIEGTRAETRASGRAGIETGPYNDTLTATFADWILALPTR